jgi:hypothetical protein
VQRLGEGERAELLKPGHGRQPALLLLLRPEHGDRLHSRPGLNAQELAQAAVSAVDLHVYQPGGDRAHRRAAVPLDAVADNAEPGQLLDQWPRELRTLPEAVDDRQHLAVDKVAGAPQVAQLFPVSWSAIRN